MSSPAGRSVVLGPAVARTLFGQEPAAGAEGPHR